MTFTSSIFLIGILPVLILIFTFYGKKKNVKIVLLVLSNVIFYIFGGIGTFLILILVSIVSWCFCVLLRFSKKRVILFASIATTILPLLFFKYTDFLITNVNCLTGLNMKAPMYIVPLGISFYSFEAISVMCDVYKGKIGSKISLIEMFTYLSFFPTVSSGPIFRYMEFRKGLQSHIDTKVYQEAIERIAAGLIKKVIFADKIAILADYYFDGVAAGRSYSALGLWLGSIAYTLQIYYDFSGYSDMTIGIGKMLGFIIPENFDKPYQSKNIGDFWRRWHISLSEWFRDYVYIPLGGNRCGALKHVFNLLFVWLLTGIWHGADWTFLIWGLGYFLLLLIEKYTTILQKMKYGWLQHIYTLFFVNLLWVFFRAENVNASLNYIGGMFQLNNNLSIESKAICFIPFMTIMIVLCAPLDRFAVKYKLNDKKKFITLKNVLMIALSGWAICAVVNSSYAPYIYGNF